MTEVQELVMMDLFPIEGGGGDRRPSAPGECKGCHGPTITTSGRVIAGAVYCEACAQINMAKCGPYRSMNSEPLEIVTGRPRDPGNEGRVLQAISEHDGLTSADIVRITGMPMGTVYEYVYNLRDAGVIVLVDNTRRYKKYVLAGAGKL